MKKLLLLLPGFALIMTACTAQKANSNPLVGTWTSNFDGCVERYEFRADGVRTYVSNQESGTAAYSFTKIAENQYKVTDMITQTNGGLDCSGKPGTKVGHKVTIYIQLNNEGKEMVMCGDAGFSNCIQPFVKQ